MSEPVPFWTFALYFLRLGATGFGGPIALAGFMQRDLVDERGLHGRVAIAHTLHAPADRQAPRDDAHRLRCQANNAAMVLPSVTPP